MVGLAVASIEGCSGLFQQIYNSLVPVALHGPLLTDQSGLPRYWSAIWSVVSSGQLAASTHTKKLRYIEDLYAHADRLRGKHALDDALGSLNEAALAEILESWFVSIRNRSTVTGSDEKRWQTGLAFVTSTVTWLSTSGTSNDRLQRIEQRIHWLYAFLKSHRLRFSLSLTYLHRISGSTSPPSEFARLLKAARARPRAGSAKTDRGEEAAKAEEAEATHASAWGAKGAERRRHGFGSLKNELQVLPNPRHCFPTSSLVRATCVQPCPI